MQTVANAWLLSRGKIVVDVSGVTLGLDIGQLVDFLLRNKTATATSMATAAEMVRAWGIIAFFCERLKLL